MANKNDKKEILIDSIRKLMDLKVSDDEIVVHLGEVGIKEEQARVLIREAREPQAAAEEEKFKEAAEISKPKEKGILEKKEEFLARFAKKPRQKPLERIPPFEEESAEEHEEEAEEEEELEAMELEEMGEPPSEEKEEAGEEQSTEEILEEALEKQEEKVEEKPREVEQPQQREQPKQYIDISKLWEKGILSAIDQRLNEMKKISENVEKAITRRADEIAKKEVDKIRILFESQQRLFMEKVNAQLDKKSKEFEQLVDQKISEMKNISQSVKKDVSALEEKREKHKEFLQNFESKLAELNEIKKRMLSEMNTELIKEKSALQEFLDSAQSRITEMDERVNKTLEVSSSIIEGLRADAESKLESMVVGRSEELNKEAREQLEELKDTQKAFESQIKEHLQKIGSMEKSLNALREEMRSSIEKDMATGVKGLQELRQKYEKQIEDRLNQLEKLVEAIHKEFDPEMFKQQMSDLEIFKKQFVKVIEGNVDRFNQAVQRINEQAGQAEDQINKRIKLIDKKIKELGEFEKNFAAEMGLTVEKSFEEKKSKKSKK